MHVFFSDTYSQCITMHVSLLRSSLQDAFAEEVRECVSALTQGSSASQLRKRHADLQERVQGLWNMVHLFEKAIPLFEGQYMYAYITESINSMYIHMDGATCTHPWYIYT